MSNRLLTDNEINKYIDGGGAHCPFCGDGDIEGGPFDVDEFGAEQWITCSCGAEWSDVYTLTKIRYVASDE